MSSKPLNLEALTAVQVADLLGVTDRAVRKWIIDKGLPVNDGTGVKTLNWRLVLPWFVKFSGSELGTGGTVVKFSAPEPVPEAPPVPPESYEKALARKTRAEADMKELQLAEKRGQVASIQLVEKVLAASTSATRTLVEAIPSRLAVQLVGVGDRNTVHALLSREVGQLLTNLATIDAVREAHRELPAGDSE